MSKILLTWVNLHFCFFNLSDSSVVTCKYLVLMVLSSNPTVDNDKIVNYKRVKIAFIGLVISQVKNSPFVKWVTFLREFLPTCRQPLNNTICIGSSDTLALSPRPLINKSTQSCQLTGWTLPLPATMAPRLLLLAKCGGPAPEFETISGLEVILSCSTL